MKKSKKHWFLNESWMNAPNALENYDTIVNAFQYHGNG